MEEPESVQAEEVVSAEVAAPEEEIVQAGPKSKYPKLYWALGVALAGVIGKVLIYSVPVDFGQENLWEAKLLSSLFTVSEAIVYIGVIWLGVLLAYWGILKSRR